MKIVFHILLKDLIRHWIEIGLFVFVTAAWAFQTAHPGALFWLQQRNVLPVLLFLLWFFLTVRVVQGESLVGDREFWTTRPYRWWQLMAAKAIFLFVCLNLPLMEAQIYLLMSAGLPFTSAWIPGLIWLALEFAVFLTLPAVALASITESLVQWVLTIVGVGIFVMLVSWLPWSKLPATLGYVDTAGGLISAAIALIAMTFIVFWQYIRRRVWPARFVLAAAAIAIPIVVALASMPWLQSRAYPTSASETPIHLSIRNVGPDGSRAHYRTNTLFGSAKISIPVRSTDLAPDTVVSVEGSRITLDGPDGWHWQSPWSKVNINLDSDQAEVNLTFEAPNDLADRIDREHITAKAEVAVSVYRLSAPVRIDTSSEQFKMPGGVVCHWQGMRRYGDFSTGEALDCAAPFRGPEILVQRLDSADATCASDREGAPLPAGHYATSSEWDTGGTPADFDPDPVHKLSLFLSAWKPAVPTPNGKGHRTAFLCRGAPITIRTGSFATRTQITSDLGEIGTAIAAYDHD